MSLANDPAVFRITDGTTTIDLLNDFGYMGWRPSRLGIKQNQSWADSPFAIGTYPVFMQYATVTETVELTAQSNGNSQDLTIKKTQELGRLLEKARQYWLTDWQDEPVWIEARANCETNMRYGLIVHYELPSDDDPYVPGFSDQAIMENFMLELIHLPWSENEPGESDCVQVSGQQDAPYPWYLDADAVSPAYAEIPNVAAIQDLPSAGDFTAEAWFYYDTTVSAGVYVFTKPGISATNGWYLTVSSNQIVAEVYHSVTNALAVIVAGIVVDAWFHIALTWDLATKTVRVFINGVEAAYAIHNAGAGVYQTDVADVLNIGRATTTHTGKVGWARLSDIERYTATFIPQARCALPEIDGNTIGAWIYEGTGTALDNLEGTAGLDGTFTGYEWEYDCGTDGQAATCDPVHFSLKHILSQLTHLFYYDASAGTYTGNLLGSSLPYALLPAVPQINDALYVGVQSTVFNNAVFDNIIFNLSTASGSNLVGRWEYWDGAAWQVLTVVDTTNGLRVAGIGSVTFSPPSDWATTTINAQTCWYVRFFIPAGIGVVGAPQQGTNDVFTAIWPYVDIDEAQVPGDIIAQAFAQIENVHRDDSNGIKTSRYIIASRTVGRGADFTPYVNISDQQVPAGFTITISAQCAYASNNGAPTGRLVTYTAVGASNTPVQVTIDSTKANTYYGKFRVYLVAKQSTVVATATYQLGVSIGSGDIAYNDPVTSIDANSAEVLYLGNLEIPPSVDISNSDVITQLDLYINVTGAAGDVISFYELVLMPADEFIVDTYWFESTTGTLRVDHKLDVDSIQYPKRTIRTWQKDDTDYEVAYINDAVGEFALQANTDQRLWFFGAQPGTNNWQMAITTHAIQLFRNARYFSMRGNR